MGLRSIGYYVFAVTVCVTNVCAQVDANRTSSLSDGIFIPLTPLIYPIFVPLPEFPDNPTPDAPTPETPGGESFPVREPIIHSPGADTQLPIDTCLFTQSCGVGPDDFGMCWGLRRGSDPVGGMFQWFGDLLSSPIRACSALACELTEGGRHHDSPTVQICTEPIIYPARHVFSCVNIEPEGEGSDCSSGECQNRTPAAGGLSDGDRSGGGQHCLRKWDCAPGQYCLDDRGNPGMESFFRMCNRGRPRTNESCRNVQIPDNQSDQEFAKTTCCMMKEMTRYTADYDLIGGNCGGTASLVAQCAGGIVTDPLAQNAGIGCGWRDRKFLPPHAFPGEEINGEQLCQQLREACTCTAEL